MNEQDIYLNAIEKWGRDPQEDVMIEEMAELIIALLKLRRLEKYSKLEGSEWKNKYTKLKENLHEELADVQIMVNQMILIHANSDQVSLQKMKKLERTAKRLL